MARKIGDALINVTPDTAGFVPQLQAKLKAAFAAVRPQVPVAADTTKIDAAIAATRAKIAGLKASLSDVKLGADAKALNAQIAAARANIAGLEAQASRLKMNADTKAAIAKIAALRQQQARLGDALESMTADVDIRAANTKIVAIRAEIKYLKSELLKNKVGADWSALNAAIIAARARLAVLQDQAKNIKLDADTSALRAKLAAAEAELRTLTDKRISIAANTGPAVKQVAALGGAALLAGTGFGFLANKIPLFGVNLAKTTANLLNSVSVFHLLADVILEVAAVVGPAAIALAAFGIAASSTVNDIVKTEKAFFTITTAMKNMNVQFPGLKTGLQNFTDSVRPQVYVLFGEALNTINAHAGLFQKLATGAGQVLDNLGARAENALGGSGLNGLVAHGVGDLQLLGNIAGNVFGIFGNVLKSLPEYAQLLFRGLQDVTGALEQITASGAVQGLLKLGLALHGAVLWGGLAVTALLALRGPLTRLGSLFVTAALEVASYVVEVAAAEGASATFAAVMAPLAAINPFVWVAAAIGLLAGLAVWLGSVKTSAQQSLDSINQLAAAATTFSGVTQALTQGLQDTNAQLAQTPKYITVSSIAGHDLIKTVTELNPAYAGLAGNVKALSAEQAVQATRVTELNKITGSAAKTQEDLQAIGVKGLDIYKLSASAYKTLVTEVQAYTTATTVLAGYLAGPAAAAQNALTNSYLQETLPAIQKITKAEDDLLNVITGGEQAFVSFQQSIGQIGSDLGSAGAAVKGLSSSSSWASINAAAKQLKVNITGLGKTQALTALRNAADQAYGAVGGLSRASLTLSSDFYGSVIPAAQKLLDSLREQGISTGDLIKVTATSAAQMLRFAGSNEAARSVIVDLINNALGRGTVTLQSLNKWVGANGVSLDQMNKIVADSTIKAGQLTKVLSSTLNTMEALSVLQAHGGQQAWNTFATSVASGTIKSKAFQTATQDVIAQLLIQSNRSVPEAKKAFEEYAGPNGLGLSISAADTLWKESLPAVQRQLANTGASADTARGKIRDLAGQIEVLHGKVVNVVVNASGSGSITAAENIPGGVAAKQDGHLVFFEAGGRVGGSGNRDTVPAMLTPGEVVVPKTMVAAGAVDHLRGKLPGFAAGGLVEPVDFAASQGGAYVARQSTAFAQAAAAAFRKDVAAAAAAASFTPGAPASGSAAAAQAFARSILPAGWSWPALQALWDRESGWNAWAVNPSSGAYGIPQALGKGHPYDLGDYANQVRWGISYIAGRYGNSQNAWAHEVGFNWYSQGGLVKDQGAELRAYGQLAATTQAALAHPGAWLKAHRKSVTRELGTLGRRQAGEQLAYQALAGRGMTKGGLSKFATKVREELRTDRDKYLSLAEPALTANLAAALDTLEVAVGGGVGGRRRSRHGGGGGGAGSGGRPLSPRAAALLARYQAAERETYRALTSDVSGALAHPIPWVKDHAKSLRGELTTLARRQASEQLAYTLLRGAGLTTGNLSKFDTRVRAEYATDRDKYLGFVQPTLTDQLARDLRALLDVPATPGGGGSGGGVPRGGGGSVPGSRRLASGLTLAQYRADLQEVHGLSPAAIEANPHLRHVWHLLHEQHVADLAGRPYAGGGVVFDRGGTLHPGPNLVFNQTGRPERLSPDGGASLTVNVHFHGPVGSQAQLQDWLAESVREIVRTRGGGDVVKTFSRR